jgi:outer membrane immunogenic protein
MTRLRTGLAAGGLLLLTAGASIAADLNGPRISMKDSEPAEHQRACGGERFSGFYAGATVGQTNLHSKWEEISADAGLPNQFVDFSDHPLKTTRSGASGGLTLGYNRVRCNFLLGIESDFNFASISGSTNHFPTNPDAGPGYAKITDGIRDYATLRGRMGFVRDNTLFFATGGLAWANLTHRMDDMMHFDGGQQNPTFSGWKTGWTIGGGFEHALTQAVSLKAEALYMDFGKRDYQLIDNLGAGPDTYIFKSRSSASVARVGLNIKLGDFPPRGGSGCDDGRGNGCGHPMK